MNSEDYFLPSSALQYEIALVVDRGSWYPCSETSSRVSKYDPKRVKNVFTLISLCILLYPLSSCASEVIDKERSRHSGMTSEITDGQREIRTPGPNLTDFMMQLEDYTPTVREIVAILARKIGTFCVADIYLEIIIILNR